MANENDKKREGYIKNPELLSSEKKSIDQILADGPQRVPNDGQSFSTTYNQGRQDIQKPGVWTKDSQTNNMQTDKDNNQQQTTTTNKGKANWDNWKNNDSTDKNSLTINHDKEIQQRIESKEQNADKDLSVNKDQQKDKNLNKDYDKDK